MPTFHGREYQLKCNSAAEAKEAVIEAAEAMVAKMTSPKKLAPNGRSKKLALWEAVHELYHWQNEERKPGPRTGPS